MCTGGRTISTVGTWITVLGFLRIETTCAPLLARRQINPRIISIFSVVGTTPIPQAMFGRYRFQGIEPIHGLHETWQSDMLGSSVWIRLQTADTTNLPKPGSSCNLIHDRYVFMAGGCWGNGIGNCVSYSYNPLLYDISVGDWNWNYNVNTTGYTVPKQIQDIIGGR
jgi:hypothetical protein